VNRMVALKVIRPELTGNPAILDRFKQELVLSHQVTTRMSSVSTTWAMPMV